MWIFYLGQETLINVAHMDNILTYSAKLRSNIQSCLMLCNNVCTMLLQN